MVNILNDNFQLYKSLKDICFEIFDFTENIPRKYLYIKSGIEVSLTTSIKLVRYYIVNKNETYRIRIKYLKDLIVELSMIDFYFDFMYNKKYLGKNRYTDFSLKLESIRRITYGVINSEKKQCEIQ